MAFGLHKFLREALGPSAGLIASLTANLEKFPELSASRDKESDFSLEDMSSFYRISDTLASTKLPPVRETHAGGSYCPNS